MHPHRSHLLAATFSGFLACTGIAACEAPLHLDPAGAGGGSSSTGSASHGCRSNTDCAFPKAVCDQATGVCVECIALSDCAYMPGAVCSKGSCTCPPGGSCGGGATASTGSASSSGAGAGGAGAGGATSSTTGTGGTATSSTAATTAAASSSSGGACVPKCAEALLKGGAVCPGTVSANDYTNLQQCAACGGTATCAPSCALTFCSEQPVNGACKSCLQSHCSFQLAACQVN